MNEKEKLIQELEPFIRHIVDNTLEIYDKTKNSKTVKGKVVNVLASKMKYDCLDIMRVLEDD